MGYAPQGALKDQHTPADRLQAGCLNMRSDTLHCLGHGAGLKVGSGKVLRNWGHKPTYLCKLFPNKHGFWYPHLVIKQKNWSWNRSICGSIQWLYMPSHPWTHIVDGVRKNKVATTRSAPVIACVGGAVSIQSCCSMLQHIIVSIDTCLMTAMLQNWNQSFFPHLSALIWLIQWGLLHLSAKD